MGNDKRSLMAGQTGHLFRCDYFISQFIKVVAFRYIGAVLENQFWLSFGTENMWLGDILSQQQIVSQAFLGHILGIFWAYLGHILGISWPYLGHILVFLLHL